MWDLWWTKWHWDRFFSEYFGFPLSISFYRCSITIEKQKNLIIIFIFLIGLHNKPSRLRGCSKKYYFKLIHFVMVSVYLYFKIVSRNITSDTKVAFAYRTW
jgi:uncharacterized membrane protein YiaA